MTCKLATNGARICFLAFVGLLNACTCSKERSREETAPSAMMSVMSPVPTPSVSAPTTVADDATPVDPCGADMIFVAGNYCTSVEQRCLEYHSEYLHDKKTSDRCLRYEKPSRCVGKRRPMQFCMDRFEYPNREGEVPITLVSWRQAVSLCGKLGKRLCTEDEFNFACEGEEMLPYVNGFDRDPKRCNIDKPYRKREKNLKTFDQCPQDPVCAAEMARLDQRHRVGEVKTCVSPFGVFDLNGNVNEWVMLPRKESPNRSGLKGGWWGPVRCRCRPTVTFHKEFDYGYEAGFRCCKDSPSP